MRKAISDTLQRVLMVPPKYFSIQYVINPWMKANAIVDRKKAMNEWQALKRSIELEGVQVLTMDQVEGLPDMVFACNSGLVHGNNIYLSRFRHPERAGEQQHYAEFYKKLGLQLLGTDYPEYFEGGGDAVFSDEQTLWAGCGPRTSKKAYEYVRQLGDDFDIVLCELVDPNYYHLDTCFCPVGTTSALWFPPAFSAKTQKEIQRRLPAAIAVSPKEATAFVCNAINIRRKVITPPGMAAKTKETLASLDYTVDEVKMDEFMKSGGACQCLVMKL